MTCFEVRNAIGRTRLTPLLVTAILRHNETCPSCAEWLAFMGALGSAVSTPEQRRIQEAETTRLYRAVDEKIATDPEFSPGPLPTTITCTDIQNMIGKGPVHDDVVALIWLHIDTCSACYALIEANAARVAAQRSSKELAEVDRSVERRIQRLRHGKYGKKLYPEDYK